jgi:hypothetical protein
MFLRETLTVSNAKAVVEMSQKNGAAEFSRAMVVLLKP